MSDESENKPVVKVGESANVKTNPDDATKNVPSSGGLIGAQMPSDWPHEGEPKKDKIGCWGKFERVIRVFEFLAFVFIVVTGIYSIITTKVLRGQLQEMGNATKVTEAQLREMQEDRNLDQRAWISPLEISKWSDNGYTNSFYFILRCKNIGKTPAFHVETVFDIQTNLDMIRNAKGHFPTNFGAGVTFPDNEFKVKTREYPISLMVSTANGNSTTFVWGIVFYDDIFGEHHWTKFCYSQDFLNNIAYPAQIGNECDTNN